MDRILDECGMLGDVTKLFEKMWEDPIKLCLIPETKRQQSFEDMLEFMIRKIGGLLQGFPYRERLNLRPEVKCNSKAHGLRDAGNRKFRPNQVDELARALMYYNESIAYAEKGSGDRATAYANRASVCLQFHRYKDCLVNVRLARESNCSAQLEEKLKNREEIARKSLAKGNTDNGTVGPDKDSAAQNDRNKAVKTLKLSYEAHANAPQAAKCLQLRQNAEFGRHVVTDRALKAGDVVMIEKPYVSILSESMHYVRCAHCLEERAFTLIPCEGCTTHMYCSVECLRNGQHYHRYECGAMRDLWRIADRMARYMVGLRAVTVTIATFGHDLDALQKHLDELQEPDVNGFTLDWRTATPMDKYNTVHVLVTNDAIRERKDMALQIFHCTIIHQLLLERTELGAMCAGNPKKKKLIFDLILRHWQIGQTNGIPLHHTLYSEETNGYRYWSYGIGYFPLLSMLNHSCVPNVQQITLPDGRSALVAINPIAAGEQLFDSYFFSPENQRSLLTILYLRRYFIFSCQCHGCQLQITRTSERCIDDIRFLQRIYSIKPASKRLEQLVAYMNEPTRHYSPHCLTALQTMYMAWARHLHTTTTYFKCIVTEEQ